MKKIVLPLIIGVSVFTFIISCKHEIPPDTLGGVVFTSYAQIMTTGDIRPGNHGGSEAFEKITDPDNSDRKPPAPRNRLSAGQIDVIRKWVNAGAPNN